MHFLFCHQHANFLVVAANTQLEYLEATQPGAVDRIHAIAVAMYFNLGDQRSANNLTEAGVIGALNKSLNAYRPRCDLAALAAQRAVCSMLGVLCVC